LTGPTYAARREDVASTLSQFIATSRIRIAEADALSEGLAIWATTRLSLIDAVHAALVRRSRTPELYSWDREFDKLPGIARLEPMPPRGEEDQGSEPGRPH